jgi:formylglycine-generating enzyme required for sulfatase activity/serine/threonine protein kinase
MLSPNTILQNRYRIVRELGHGGMGTVYEAVDQRVNCIVALKETTAGNDGEAKRAFEREASLLANLRHSSLPKVMDYFTEDEGDFLVMEFIPGYDLAELLESRESPFPQSQVLRWAIELLRVLEYLHKQEPPILHRDIKPSNLKLTKNGEVFLLDFGLAKGALGQMPTLAASRSVRGYTPIYASLEQIHGHGTDPRSDLYSLGATLYHLLSGVPPVDAPTRFHVVEDGDADPLPLIQKVNPQASSNVAGVIHQAMALRRKDRPISAAEMSRALRNAAEEDERESAEEEYRRAEARGHERKEQRRRAAEVAATRPDEDQRREQPRPPVKERHSGLTTADFVSSDVEALLKAEQLEAPKRAEAEDARLQAEERRREEEKARGETAQRARREQARAEQARPKEEEAPREPPVIQSTIPAPPGATIPAAEFVAPPQKHSQPAIKTIPAPPPEKLKTDRDSAAIADRAAPKAVGAKRNFVIAACVLIAIVGAIVIWSLQGSDSTSTTNLSLSNTQANSDATSSSLSNNAPAGMVYVPGGTFMMGRDDGDEYERPAHEVTVRPFFIDIYEVTNEEYAKFVKATNHKVPQTWTNGTYGSGDARKPVTGVTWDDANDYARWSGKRLPTEEEWEFAARGTDRRRYPWGSDWRNGFANANNVRSQTADVGTYTGASPYLAYDMVGNAWEWTASDMAAYPGGKLPEQPAMNTKVLRGGSFESKMNQATVTYRYGWRAREEITYAQAGFRCAKDVTGDVRRSN